MRVLNNVSLKPFTTFNLGGNAEYFISANTKDELFDAVLWSKQTGVPYMILGGGSNLLVSDKGFDGLIIRNQLKGISKYKKGEDIFIGIGAGESWDEFVAYCVGRGLYGVENMSGIPGSVGATPIQNVGAYGREVKDVISWVEVFNPATMQLEILKNSDCKFGYRDSIFKQKEGSNLIVTEVGFKLREKGELDTSYRDVSRYFNDVDEEPTLISLRDAVLSIRAGKFPDLNQYGCGGSFFKNPIISRNQLRGLQSKFKDIPHYSHEGDRYKIPLAWVLEHAVPWKGVRRKYVGVSESQPLILINYGNGSAEEIKKLSDDITLSVKNETNILISPEVRFVGNF